ncbi:MAG: RNA polymerase sigma factor [Campylobacteraceae bacterium]|nr:RNA polymerase sigma factor [Campylobacteraceae bacterium]
MLAYYKELIYYVQRMVGDKDNAKDVVQEAYSRVIHVDNKTTISNKRAYLYKMVRNIVIDDVRKNKNIAKIAYEEEQFVIPSNEQPDELTVQDNTQQVLMSIVQNLPTRSKQAFIFHILEGYSRKEIALKMGINISTVDKHITHATLKIKKELEEQ